MFHKLTARLVAGLFSVLVLAAMAPSMATAQEAPDALIRRLSTEILTELRANPAYKAGDIDSIIALVDKSVMPNVNFRRMTAAAVGPAWRSLKPEQQAQVREMMDKRRGWRGRQH